jgi:hypothetical protein
VPRILICGEGPHDIGSDVWDSQNRRHVQSDGWLQCILRKLVAERIEFIRCERRELVLLPRQQRNLKPLPAGHGKKAAAAMFRGQSAGCDIVVFMVDADSPDRLDWKRIRDEITAGLSKFDNAKGVACVPMSASESWLLADREAWLQLGLEDGHVLPRRPEHIWGEKHDPSSDRPHNYFARMCELVRKTDSREIRVELGNALAIETLKERCPISFKSFAAELSV